MVTNYGYYRHMTKAQLQQVLQIRCLQAGGQAALAKAAKIPKQRISDVLSGRREPNEKLLRYLGLQNEYVFSIMHSSDEEIARHLILYLETAKLSPEKIKAEFIALCSLYLPVLFDLVTANQKDIKTIDNFLATKQLDEAIHKISEISGLN
jgi:hypothetical protein